MKTFFDPYGNKIQLDLQPSGLIHVEVFGNDGGYYFGTFVRVLKDAAIYCALATRAVYRFSDETLEDLRYAANKLIMSA